jgi:hypothetical protein
MKKLLLFFVVSLFSVAMFAQTIESLKDGAAFSMTSPNGVYLAGNMEDAAAYYNVKTRTIKSLQGDVQDDGGCTAWDINDKGQVAVDWKGHAAIWTEKDGFEALPMPNGLSAAEEGYNAARCLSNDGKYVVVSFGSPTTTIYLYTLGEDGVYTMEKIECPEVAPIYNQIPQFIAPYGITNDGNRILGRFLVETGEFELPFVWERTPGGDWTIRWIAEEFIVEGGKTDAVFYGTEFVFDGDQLDDPEGYEAAYNEWLEMRNDYYATIDAVSSGYFFQGTMGDLSDLGMSLNGKYAKMNISYKDVADDAEDAMIYNYPAVIDLETEEVYVFDVVTDGGCLSVTNDGIISIATPKVEYFRSSLIASIANTKEVKTLTQWTLEKTNNVINLADYMTYETPNGAQLAEGGTILFADGSGYMTNQYNGFGDTQSYETYIETFGSNTAVDVVYDNNMLVYPNPTAGVLNFSDELSNVRVFDVTGRMVYSVSDVVTSVDLSKIAAGTYFLVAEKEGEQVSTKVIVK